MTIFRAWAQRKGVVIAAGHAGKMKAVLQNVFIGGTLTWFAFRDIGASLRLGAFPLRPTTGITFTAAIVATTLAIALTLPIYSFVDYMVKYRRLFTLSS